MSDFIPPYPIRHKEPLSPLKTLQYARRDLLSIWSEKSFRLQFMGTKIINRSVFIANCPQVVKHVFVTKHDIYERKSPQMRKALAPLLGDGLFISDGATWKKHRQLETPLFTAEHVAQYSKVMVEVAEEYVQKWSKLPAGTSINVLTEMGTLTAEIICRALFGNHLGAAQAAEVISSFAEYQAAIEQMDFGTFFGLPSWMPGLQWRRAKKAATRIHVIVDNVIAAGIKSSNEESLLAHLLRLRGGAKDELTVKQIRNELIVLFMAGHETTANTLSWAWYLISQVPEVEQKMHTEIDTVLGSQTAQFDHYANLTYTRAIIDETLRLYPPVPILSREASQDDIIRKRHVAKGSIMLVVPWLLHRHELFWEQPNHFIPERFLPDAVVKPDKFVYVPFSAGPRVCIAKFFGSVESALCLAVLARNFRLTLPVGTKVTHDCRLTLRPKDNLPMQIVPR